MATLLGGVNAVPSSPVNLQVRLADLAGDKFKDMFYAIFDSHRSDLPRFFSPTAVVVWEGNSVTGSQQLTHLFSVLPPTKHTLTSIDSHPITPPNTTPTASSSAAPQSLLVSVSGTVVYGLDSGGVRGFFHSFVLEKGSGGVGYSYIVSASFRTRQLIEPEKPKKQYRSSV